MSAGKIQKTYRFHGRVQGVGFRFGVLQIANQLNISGYVRNLDNGQVELVAEGSDREIGRLVTQIVDSRAEFVEDVTCITCDSPEGMSKFEIRR